AAGDGVGADARAEAAPPTQALLLDAGSFRLRAEVDLQAGAVGLSECVAAHDERDGLRVVEAHAPVGLPDVATGHDGIRHPVRALRVDVDQTHLGSGQRIFEFAGAGMPFIAEPGVLGTPADVRLGLPGVHAAAREAEGL